MAIFVEPFSSLRSRLLHYAERRLPALTRLRQTEVVPITLHRRRIYVLPTSFGIGFAILLFVMLIGSLNYNNNAALLLTCLLLAAAWLSLFTGFRNLAGLSLLSISAHECHAGNPLSLRFIFASTINPRTRPSLHLHCGSTETTFSIIEENSSSTSIELPTAVRGWFRPGRLKLWTDYPLGLFQIWSWLNPDVAFLIFPTAEVSAPSLPAGFSHHGEHLVRGASDELAGLRHYRSSDPPRLIAWKASARHDVLLVRESESRSDNAVVLDFSALRHLDTEARIRRLTAWVLEAEAHGKNYTLVLPGEQIGPGLGTHHRLACLRALALVPYSNST